jgi:hypothetical protein
VQTFPRPKAESTRGRVFFIPSLAAESPWESAFIYGGLASGRLYVESDTIGLAGGSYSTYIYCAANPLTKTDSSGEGFIDCARALAELQAATLNVELRLADIIRCGNRPDPGHIKALKQAVNRLQNAYDAVYKHCGSYIGAAAALAIAAEVLAEAAAVLAGA